MSSFKSSTGVLMTRNSSTRLRAMMMAASCDDLGAVVALLKSPDCHKMINEQNAAGYTYIFICSSYAL